MQKIMDLCEAVESKQGARVGMQWWEQAGLDLAVSMETTTVVVEVYGDVMEE